MFEVAVLIDLDHSPIYWHEPLKSSVEIPDSVDLWSQIWANRNSLLGIAHSHPGTGIPQPSTTDLTTFSAIEAALGQRLLWWITSDNILSEFQWTGKSKTSYKGNIIGSTAWIQELRQRSQIHSPR